MLRPLLLPLMLALLLVATCTARAQDPLPPPESHAVAPSADGHVLLWPTITPETALAHPILRRGHDMGLITTGIVGLTLGMVVGVLIASTDLALGNCTSFSRTTGTTPVPCGTAPFSLVPIVGPVLAGAVNLDGHPPPATTIIAGSLALAPQIAGLILLWIGMYGFTEDLIPEASVGDVVVRLAPILSSSELGASLSMSL